MVDPQRQFVYGISYGGYMTCWLVGHTKQFRAAVAQNAVTDLNVMWGRSDLQSWTEWEFGGRPWEVPAAMRRHSPITYVGQCQTPTLILHSRDDRRCPSPWAACSTSRCARGKLRRKWSSIRTRVTVSASRGTRPTCSCVS